MINEAYFAIHDPNLRDKMNQLVEEALLSEFWKQETMALAIRTYQEEDYLQWVLSFRDLVKLNKVREDLYEYLFELLTVNDFSVSRGALSLIISADTINKELDLKHKLYLFFNHYLHTGDYILIINIFSYLYETSTELQSKKRLIELLKANEQYIPYLNSLEEYLKYPFKELLEEYANSCGTKTYNQFLFFLKQATSVNIVSKLTFDFFNVYNNCKDDIKIKRLYNLIKQLSIDSYDSEFIPFFINNVLDNKAILNKYVNYLQLQTPDTLRYIAVKAPNKDHRKWTQRILKNIKWTDKNEYEIAARGNLADITQDTFNMILDVYHDFKNKEFNYNVLLPPKYTDVEDLAGIVQNETATRVPINIEHIAKLYGIPIVGIEDNSSFDGCLFRAPDLPFPIVVYNKCGRSQQRQKFTIGHELGHYLMFHSFDLFFCEADEWVWSPNVKREEETEANKFSAALLMPIRELRNDLKYGIGAWNRIKELKDKYQVSLVALSCRLIGVNAFQSVIIKINENKRISWFHRSHSLEIPDDSLPPYGSICPTETGAYKILNGEIEEFNGQIPLYRWIDISSVREYIKDYTLYEYSIKISGNDILTILEFEEPERSGDHDDYDIDADKHKRGLTYRNIYRL